MTKQEAYRLLGVSKESSVKEIKLKYKKLMLLHHPDNTISGTDEMARSLNEAYAIIVKNKPETNNNITDYQEDIILWDAPVNENAYAKREVYDSVEDYDGTVLGNICIAKGKFFWTEDENFSLFLLSIFKCSKDILEKEKFDDIAIKRLQPELTYLLAQQYIDGYKYLNKLTENKDGVYKISAMVNSSGVQNNCQAGEYLFPLALRNHRLFFKDKSGQEIGYLSFKDDRLYYIIIPMFEQRRVQIKVQVTKIVKSRQPYFEVDLWIKYIEKYSGMPENINMQIKRLISNK